MSHLSYREGRVAYLHLGQDVQDLRRFDVRQGLSDNIHGRHSRRYWYTWGKVAKKVALSSLPVLDGGRR